MSTVANVERKIRRVEGFRIRILHLSGADVRGDRSGLPQYSYHRAADSHITVETWKETRFRPSYPGFEVDVLDRRGNSMQGNTKLSTVRETYHYDIGKIKGPARPALFKRQAGMPVLLFHYCELCRRRQRLA